MAAAMESMMEMVRRQKWWLAGLVVIATSWLWLAAGNDGVERIVYSTVTVERGDVIRSVTASGTVSALITVEVGSQLSGQVAELYADYNTEVEAGQLVALIDPQTFEARVRQARAEREVAVANLAIQQAARVAEEASLREAERDFERKQSLAQKGHISEAELDTTRATLETTAARLRMAEAQIRNAEAVIKQRDASLFQAEIDLERTEIRAPVNGTVIERNVEVGQTVAASLSSPVLFRIAQNLRQMQVEANVDEADIGNLEEGNEVSFDVDAYPERTFRGVVEQIRKAPVSLENVVTYTTVISAPNDDLKLLPGMTATVEIIPGQRKGVLRVGNAALRFKPKGIESTDTAAPPGFGAPGGSPQFAERMVGRMTASLDLTSDQQTRLRAALGRNSAPPPPDADRAVIFAQLRSRLERTLVDILTPEQLVAYREITRHNGPPARRGQLWAENGSGGFESKSVRLGISDDNFTEILDGDVKAGDRFISRARTVFGGDGARASR